MVVLYLRTLNRKYVVCNVNNNAVSNFNVKRNFNHFLNQFLVIPSKRDSH